MQSLQSCWGDDEDQYPPQLEQDGPALKRAKTISEEDEIQSNCLFHPNASSSDDCIGCWPRCDQHSLLEQLVRPSKKPRISEDAQSISSPYPPLSAVMSNNFVGFWENVDRRSRLEQHAKPRIPEEKQTHSLPYPLPMNAIMAAPNAPVNNGANSIFFKTRLCAKFMVGKCKNGENCNFAHGIEDMRRTFIFQ